MASECIFCSIPPGDILQYGEHWIARLDKFPVTARHTLLIPKRHVSYVDELTAEEWAELFVFIKSFAAHDFNVGINRGAAAGQTVFHVMCTYSPERLGMLRVIREGV